MNAINNNYVNGFMIVQSADATENGILFFSNAKDDGIFLPESQSTELYITADKNVYEWSATVLKRSLGIFLSPTGLLHSISYL